MLGNIVTLPSRGRFYPSLVDGKVEVLPMKTLQEELLAGRPDMIPILNSLISYCVPTLKEAGIAPLELLSGDRVFLLFMIRQFTYGPYYGFKIKCPSCGLSFRQEITIPGDLIINEIPDEAVEPFTVKLSDGKTELGFKLLTGKDEVEIDRYRVQAFRRGVKQGDPSYSYTLARHVTTVNGKEISLTDAIEFIRNMVGMDSSIFQEALRKLEPGLSRELELECLQCGFEIDTLVPYNSEFFRPKHRGGS